MEKRFLLLVALLGAGTLVAGDIEELKTNYAEIIRAMDAFQGQLDGIKPSAPTAKPVEPTVYIKWRVKVAGIADAQDKIAQEKSLEKELKIWKEEVIPVINNAKLAQLDYYYPVWKEFTRHAIKSDNKQGGRHKESIMNILLDTKTPHIKTFLEKVYTNTDNEESGIKKLIGDNYKNIFDLFEPKAPPAEETKPEEPEAPATKEDVSAKIEAWNEGFSKIDLENAPAKTKKDGTTFTRRFLDWKKLVKIAGWKNYRHPADIDPDLLKVYFESWFKFINYTQDNDNIFAKYRTKGVKKEKTLDKNEILDHLKTKYTIYKYFTEVYDKKKTLPVVPA